MYVGIFWDALPFRSKTSTMLKFVWKWLLEGPGIWLSWWRQLSPRLLAWVCYWDLYRIGRESTPVDCLLISTYTLWYVCMCSNKSTEVHVLVIYLLIVVNYSDKNNFEKVCLAHFFLGTVHMVGMSWWQELEEGTSHTTFAVGCWCMAPFFPLHLVQDSILWNDATHGQDL